MPHFGRYFAIRGRLFKRPARNAKQKEHLIKHGNLAA